MAYVVIALSAVGIVLIDALAIGFAHDRERDDTGMRSTKRANDVFVTVGGKPTEPFIGWLTSTDMAALE